ncbi:MAG: hypothetical protein L3K14_01470 [Thermoplasmata archaeon]|nr:hypothetical protein [Thermoplasmata archaeon]
MTRDSSDSDASLRMPLTIYFEGPGVARNRLQLRDFLLFGSKIQAALDRVARVLQGEAGSVQPGRRPGDLDLACSLDVVSFRGGGSATLTLDLPVLKQKVLSTYEDVGEEALRTLVSGIESITDADARLPQGYDDGVLLALREAGKTFDRGLDRVSLTLGRERGRIVRVLTRETVSQIVRRIQSPVENQKVIEGRLLMADFRESGLKCRIHPLLGPPILCEFDESKREAVLTALTHIVRLVGEATEVGGEIQSLRIQDVELLDVEGLSGPLGLEVARFGDRIPSLDSLAEERGARTITELTALAEGVWPEEDDVDEFIRSVRKWRREGSSDSLL